MLSTSLFFSILLTITTFLLYLLFHLFTILPRPIINSLSHLHLSSFLVFPFSPSSLPPSLLFSSVTFLLTKTTTTTRHIFHLANPSFPCWLFLPPSCSWASPLKQSKEEEEEVARSGAFWRWAGEGQLITPAPVTCAPGGAGKCRWSVRRPHHSYDLWM